jgi:hypothetical protein
MILDLSALTAQHQPAVQDSTCNLPLALEVAVNGTSHTVNGPGCSAHHQQNRSDPPAQRTITSPHRTVDQPASSDTEHLRMDQGQHPFDETAE